MPFTGISHGLYNMYISLPREDILQFSDDVSGTFCWPRLHPWIAPAFSFLFCGILYIPSGQVFGSYTNAKNFEPIAKACTLLTQHIFQNEDYEQLLTKYAYLINNVKFSPLSTEMGDMVRAKPYPLHQGITHSDGSLKPQPFITFVDDNLMADTRSRMKHCMTASLEALFCIMGHNKLEIRRSNVSIEKYFSLTASHIQTQLGLEIDIRTMRVSLLQPKQQDLACILKHWHTCRKSFVIKEASSLLGKLNYAAEVVSWAWLLFVAIHNSLLMCMRKNKSW